MKRLIRAFYKQFGITVPSLLMVIHTFTLAHAAGQGPGIGQPPDQRAPGTIAVSASLDSSIRAVDTLMTEQGAVLLTDLRWLKWMGYLCRRTKTDIEREIAKAQANMAELQRMRESRYLDVARARMIAYALGMEADALAKQAGTLDEAFSTTENIVSSAGAETEDASRRHQLAVQTLSTMSSVLHELAKAIIANLDKGVAMPKYPNGEANPRAG